MSGNFKMDDYVDVAERIREFYERYPDGRLCAGSAPRVVEIGDKPFVWYHARAYRTPDDPVPGDGYAAEPVPGPTQFTRDSELMNAETAAWGRAIVALGFATKKIASAQEVRNRSGNGPSSQTAAPGRQAAGGDPRQGPPAAAPTDEFRFPSGKHQGKTLGEVPRDYVVWCAESHPKPDMQQLARVFLGLTDQPADDDGVPF